VLSLVVLACEAGWRVFTHAGTTLQVAVFFLALLAGAAILVWLTRAHPAGLLERAAVWFFAFTVLFGLVVASPTRAPSIDGVACTYDPEKGYHQDVHVSLFVRGRQIALPLGIGVVGPQITAYPRGPYAGGAYAGNDDCVYWMHTHDRTGIIHVEPQRPNQTFELGTFFDIWGQPLTRSQAATYRGEVRIFRWHIDDPQPRVSEVTRQSGAATLAYRSHDEITVQVGPPWAPLPRYVWAIPLPPNATQSAVPSSDAGGSDRAVSPLPFSNGPPIVLARGGTIGEPGAPAPRSGSPAPSPVRSVALALLAAGAIVAPLEWLLSRTRRGRVRAAPRVLVKTGDGTLWLAGSLGFAIVAATLFYTVPTGSAGFFDYVGRSIVEGKLPYRDIWDNKLPSIYYLNALLQLAFDSHYVLHWIVQLGFLLATIVLFASFAYGEHARHWAPATFALSVLLSLLPLQHFGYTEPYALALIMAALVAAQRRAVIASGILLCLATTFWIPAILTAIPIALYMADRPSTRFRFALGFAATAVVYAGVMLWVFTPPVIASLLHDMRSYEGLKSGGGVAAFRAAGAKLFSNLEATGLIVPLVIALGVVCRPENRTERFALTWLACALAGAAINLNFFQHYFIPSVAPLVFMLAVYADWERLSLPRKVVLGVLVAAVLTRLPHIAATMRTAISDQRYDGRVTAEVGRIVDAALPKESPILVYGTSDGIYLTAKRQASGRFANTFGLSLTAPQLVAERHAEYLDDVRHAGAVIVDASGVGAFTQLDAVLRSEFTPICVGRLSGPTIYVNRRITPQQQQC
jgi:hypothetical protein